MKYVLYTRVSTDKQGIKGLGMQAQEEVIQDFLKTQEQPEVIGTYAEAETGTKKRKRPQLHQALNLCKQEGATLVVANLSRLSRNVHFISGLVESKVNFVALDLMSCDKTMLFFLATLAEWEADTISKRTKAALAQLKKRGVKLGPKKKLTAEISAPYREEWNRRRKETAYQFADRMHPVIQYHLDKGMNYSQVAQELNSKNYTTPSGKGTWVCVTVKRCVSRVKRGTV